ncbi:MAG: FAD/NAD(P)-binding protein, partial [Rhodopila sp.]
MPDNLSSAVSYAGITPVIVIIGGGFSGTLTAIRLLDGATEPLAIKVIEARVDLGRGLAYSARDPAHLTNGPAKVFSLYPDRPDHFARYLARYGRDWGWRDPQSPDHANAHTPRWVYGDYVRA